MSCQGEIGAIPTRTIPPSHRAIRRRPQQADTANGEYALRPGPRVGPKSDRPGRRGAALVTEGDQDPPQPRFWCGTAKLSVSRCHAPSAARGHQGRPRHTAATPRSPEHARGAGASRGDESADTLPHINSPVSLHGDTLSHGEGCRKISNSIMRHNCRYRHFPAVTPRQLYRSTRPVRKKLRTGSKSPLQLPRKYKVVLLAASERYAGPAGLLAAPSQLEDDQREINAPSTATDHCAPGGAVSAGR